ncbi:MAG: FAD-binding domain-containing protein, partial [Bacteroidales bacterium]
MFDISYSEILNRVEQIDPVAYVRSRNFLNGAVTKLSPYISRGVISTRFVMNSLLNRGFKPVEILKLIQELAWRDYFQQVWKAKGDEINYDLKNTQIGVKHHEMPCAILDGKTGIQAIDKGIHDLYNTGYMHNHLRMYVASIACNVGGSHWKTPSKWLYYHLLDGDQASNTLSWQWVSGAFSSKKYYANQDNINKYCNTNQIGTFLDVEYEEFDSMQIPNALLETCMPELKTKLPEPRQIQIDQQKPTLIYNAYNLEPEWKKHEDVNRVL